MKKILVVIGIVTVLMLVIFLNFRTIDSTSVTGLSYYKETKLDGQNTFLFLTRDGQRASYKLPDGIDIKLKSGDTYDIIVTNDVFLDGGYIESVKDENKTNNYV